jgi:DNA replication protein DnaC
MTPVTERIRQSLVHLHMARALETLDQTLGRLERGDISAIEAIDELLAEELSLREGRRIGVALRTARLMPIKTLESFDFSFQPSLERNRIMAIAQLEFIGRAEVVHFLGPPGTGKSHLATAIGVAAVKAGRSVYRCTLAELIEALARAEREGRLAEKIRFYARAALLIVDEIGYLPITSGGANLFFQLVNARYEKGSTRISHT